MIRVVDTFPKFKMQQQNSIKSIKLTRLTISELKKIEKNRIFTSLPTSLHVRKLGFFNTRFVHPSYSA